MRSKLRVLDRAMLVMPNSSAAARRSKDPGKRDSSSKACRNSSGRVLTMKRMHLHKQVQTFVICQQVDTMDMAM